MTPESMEFWGGEEYRTFNELCRSHTNTQGMNEAYAEYMTTPGPENTSVDNHSLIDDRFGGSSLQSQGSGSMHDEFPRARGSFDYNLHDQPYGPGFQPQGGASAVLSDSLSHLNIAPGHMMETTPYPTQQISQPHENITPVHPSVDYASHTYDNADPDDPVAPPTPGTHRSAPMPTGVADGPTDWISRNAGHSRKTLRLLARLYPQHEVVSRFSFQDITLKNGTRISLY